jgi:hypothetical protein
MNSKLDKRELDIMLDIIELEAILAGIEELAGTYELAAMLELKGTEELARTEELLGVEELAGIDELTETEEVAGVDELVRTEELAGMDELAGTDELAIVLELASMEELSGMEELNRTEVDRILEKMELEKTIEMTDEETVELARLVMDGRVEDAVDETALEEAHGYTTPSQSPNPT